jgi:hypothetical protein
MHTDLPYRYPGVAPFSGAQKDLFFGREAEVQRLTELTHAEQQVLLYGKSGLGKSSLISAGLLPILEQQPQVCIVQIRLGAYQGPDSPAPLSSIHAALPPAPTTLLTQLISHEHSLWSHVKALHIVAPEPRRYYLIFDQFEELFTHPPASIFAFKKQMADLLYRIMPRQFRALLEMRQRAQPDLLADADLLQLHQPMDVHVLYAIREDRYSHLNQLADYLPDLLHTRFQLGPLTRAQAEVAISRPASLLGPYATAPFHFEPQALSSMLDYLTKGQEQAVETTQLQILCSRLEQLQQPEIRQEDIPAFEDIFLEFYYDCIQALPKEARDEAQGFIEDRLLIAGQRVALDRLACLEYLNADILDRLLRDWHLLRAEQNSIGGSSLEISHDTLVAPIMRARTSRQARLVEAARLAEEVRLREKLKQEQAARVRARRQLRRTRLALWAAIVAVMYAVGAMGYAIQQKSRALEQKEIANQSALEASESEEKYRKQVAMNDSIRRETEKIAQYKRQHDLLKIGQLQSNAEAFAMNGEPQFAIEELAQALLIDSSRVDIRQRINDLKRKL